MLKNPVLVLVLTFCFANEAHAGVFGRWFGNGYSETTTTYQSMGSGSSTARTQSGFWAPKIEDTPSADKASFKLVQCAANPHEWCQQDLRNPKHEELLRMDSQGNIFVVRGGKNVRASDRMFVALLAEYRRSGVRYDHGKLSDPVKPYLKLDSRLLPFFEIAMEIELRSNSSSSHKRRTSGTIHAAFTAYGYTLAAYLHSLTQGTHSHPATH